MAPPSGTASQLRNIFQLAQSGQIVEARDALSQVLRTEPENADAWLLASMLVEEPGEKRRLILRALQHQPEHAGAKRALAALPPLEDDPIEALIQGLHTSDSQPPLPPVKPIPLQPSRDRLLNMSGIGIIIVLLCILAGMAAMRFYNPIAGPAAPTLSAPLQVVPTQGLTTAAPLSTATSSLTPTVTLTRTSTPTRTSTSTPTPTPTPDASSGIPLAFAVAGAEYSRGLDRLIMISPNPDQLHIFDPFMLTDTIVALPDQPIKLAVGPDGLTAAVSFASQIAYIDLQSAEIIKLIPISFLPGDMVFGSNSWVYLVTGYHYIEIIYGINIDKETVVEIDMTYHELAALRLHPGGTKIYGVQGFDTWWALGRINIVNGGIPEFAYEAPNVDDYITCDDLWFSEDGLRIFTACSAVFHASNNSNDMTYSTSLVAEGHESILFLADLTHSAPAGRVLGIRRSFREPDPQELQEPDQIMIWDDQSLLAVESFELASLVPGSSPSRLVGEYIFASADGTKYIVIYYKLFGGHAYGLLVRDLP